MARPQRRWWWQSHLFDNDGGKLLRAFERRRRLARLHDASPEAQRSHRASRSAEGDGRLCACDVATKNSPQTKCLSQLSQFQSSSQLNGDGVKVRGWQSDSLEPAAFEHSWYLCQAHEKGLTACTLPCVAYGLGSRSGPRASPRATRAIGLRRGRCGNGAACRTHVKAHCTITRALQATTTIITTSPRAPPPRSARPAVRSAAPRTRRARASTLCATT